MILVVSGLITASEPSWIGTFSGLSPGVFGKLVAQLRRDGIDAPGAGRPWQLALEDRVLLVAAHGRTNLTMRQLAPLFGVSKSAADRDSEDLGPKLALQTPQAVRVGRRPHGGRSQRQQQLGACRQQYDQWAAGQLAEIRGHNAGITQLAGAVRDGDPEAAVEYFSAALYASAGWPEGLPRQLTAAYDAPVRQPRLTRLGEYR